MERAKRIVRIGCTCLVAWVTISAADAQTGCETPVARVVSTQGDVRLDRDTASIEDSICPGVVVRVGQNSRAAVLVLDQNTILRINENTDYTISADADQGWAIDLLKGIIHFFSDTPQRLNVKTPFMNAAVEGTEFLVTVENNQSDVLVLEGQVRVSNTQGELVLAGGQAASASQGQAPQRRQVVKPFDAVQWALYYPVIGLDEQTPDEVREANELLAVGQVDKANEILDQYKDDAVAQALQAMIAVAQNRNDEAEQLARNAVSLNPNSSTAYTALSYVQQAQFGLDAALVSAQLAVEKDSGNAYAWARLAELQSSFGNLKASLQSAQKAVEAYPGLSRTQTILGFAHLTRIEIEEAKTAFNKAINLDQGDALPRLGLGLALIRKNQLKDGREQIEIAASLDPNNSLIRSYLGKAYFEEKYDERAATQLDLAKALDSNDPTPWLYDAIRKQTLNEPANALRDIQESIRKNNNRGIYRSQLLLDQDLATRSTNVGATFRNLGFEQLALIEGWKSVDAGSIDYAPHRLLADTYSSRPRYEIARINELHVSQLFQPLNLTPLQPELSETSLFALNGVGPSDPSFNEFNPLFTRERLAIQSNGVGGSNNTYGEDIVLAGLSKKISYSIGQFHYQTDGVRENNGQERDIANLFLQTSLTPKTSFLAELRRDDFDFGDLELTFNGQFNPDLQQTESVDTFRIGVHREIDHQSSLLASLIYQDGTLGTDVIPGIFSLESDTQLLSTELRYLWRSNNFRFSSGIWHIDKEDKTTQVFFGDEDEGDTNPRHTNVYFYSNYNLLSNLDLELGVSADFTKKTDAQGNQSNPKLGITWNPNPSTTIRAAGFRTLQRPFLSQQKIDPRLEPTQIAGFNQFYFDAEGDEAWSYGTGIDSQLSPNLYTGLDYFERDLDVAINLGFDVVRRDWDERTARTYLYWIPHPKFAISGEYIYERFDRDIEDGTTGVEEFSKLNTHRFPIKFRFFHPSGFSSRISLTYVDQDGDFPIQQEEGFSVDAGSDEFWIVDAGLGYRLPKRHGIISIEARNLFNEDFRFQDTDPRNPQIVPDRNIVFRYTASF